MEEMSLEKVQEEIDNVGGHVRSLPIWRKLAEPNFLKGMSLSPSGMFVTDRMQVMVKRSLHSSSTCTLPRNPVSTPSQLLSVAGYRKSG